MFYVEEEFKWYKCENDDWKASIQYSFVMDVLNVNIPTTNFSELEDTTFISTGGTLTKYSDGSVVLFMSFLSTSFLTDDLDSDLYSFSILIPNGVTYTVRAGGLLYVDDAWRQPFIKYDGTTVKLTAEDEENSILLHTFSFTSIIK